MAIFFSTDLYLIIQHIRTFNIETHYINTIVLFNTETCIGFIPYNSYSHSRAPPSQIESRQKIQFDFGGHNEEL